MTVQELFQNYRVLADKKDLVALQGWVTQIRGNNRIVFFHINDGSFVHNVQIVCGQKDVPVPLFADVQTLSLHSAVKVTGNLLLTPHREQPFELQLETLKIVQVNNMTDYPLQKKAQGLAFLRNYDHLKMRTSFYQTITKIRSRAFFLIHQFFQSQNFVYIATPILTVNDCEGGGETFSLDNWLQNKGQTKYRYFHNLKVNLTVSGQLHLEPFAQAMHKVYTFGPTFRADKSKTTKHLAEFWMLEPEVAFSDNNANMDLIEKVVKYVASHIKNEWEEELTSLEKHTKINARQRMADLLAHPLPRIKYQTALAILQKAIRAGYAFQDKKLTFGDDFQKEHELFLVRQHFKNGVFIYDYPHVIKAFYMKQNSDLKTMAACDLIMPQVGELAGGSQRETDIAKIKTMAATKNLDLSRLSWYLDLRRFGFAGSSGFGLGFERLIMYLTGVNNIRDVIAYPRTMVDVRY